MTKLKYFICIVFVIFLFEVLFFVHVGMGYCQLYAWSQVDALTIWAAVITIVFLVFSVMGLHNIDGRIKELNEQKEKVEKLYREIWTKYSDFSSSAEEKKKDIVDKAEQEIKRLMEASATRQNLYDSLAKINSVLAPDQKIMLLTEYLQEHPQSEGLNYMYIYISRGEAYEQLGRYEDAVADYNYAIKISDSKSEYPFISLGCFYCNRREYAKSIDYFQKAVELNPKKASNWTNLANSYSALGQYDEADMYYKRAIDVNPDIASVYYNKALQVTNAQKDKTHDIAKNYYNYCLKLDPSFYKARINLASLYRTEKNELAARDEYDKVICSESNTEFVLAILQRGISNRLLGNVAAALIDFETVYHIDPHNVQNLSNLAAAHLQLGHYMEAEQFARMGKGEAEKQNNHNCDVDFDEVQNFLNRFRFGNRSAVRLASDEEGDKSENKKDEL